MEENATELSDWSSERGSLSVTPCVGCFLTSETHSIPRVFENSMRLLRSVPRLIIFLRVKYSRTPFIPAEKRLHIKLYDEIYHITATFGYADKKNKSLYNDILLLAKELYQIPLGDEENQITFFLSNQTIDIERKNLFSTCLRLPLYLYSFQKSLVNPQSTNALQINAKNTILIGTFLRL